MFRKSNLKNNLCVSHLLFTLNNYNNNKIIFKWFTKGTRRTLTLPNYIPSANNLFFLNLTKHLFKDHVDFTIWTSLRETPRNKKKFKDQVLRTSRKTAKLRWFFVFLRFKHRAEWTSTQLDDRLTCPWLGCRIQTGRLWRFQATSETWWASSRTRRTFGGAATG